MKNLSGLAYESGDGIILVPIDDQYKFIDRDGNNILSNFKIRKPSFSFFQGRSILTLDNWDYAIIDKEGNIVRSSDIYRIGQKYVEGLVSVQITNKTTGYLDISGQFAFTVSFLVEDVPLATNFNNGYAIVLIKNNPNTWKIINKSGEFVSGDIVVSDVNDFSEGFSLVNQFDSEKKINNKGYIDTKGNFLINPVLEEGDSFKNGYARIKYNGRDGLLDVKGFVFWSDQIVNGNIKGEKLLSVN